ncbi:cold-shock protein [Paenibacillus validus]|uniref:cold-shock protein n=1 Tax=Paenibacillus TaxID=44249 RepID=UPI000FDCBDBD|nr:MULTISPECIES: cold-shock protein [Paenibacillus]MED4602327.1 cold-shock protein [Paenibacillus validus]MED4607640.1 cold-shock protein [Paenibacillus validus]
MYFRKKLLEDIPTENTMIWSCENEDCKGWIRDNFAFECQPICRQCLAPMVSSMKILPLLLNSNIDFKSLKKGVQIS